jgi:CDP-glucose 4,6-dehydratase
MTFVWKDRNVFVTGATGLLGGWLTEALLERGANVVCLVRDQVPRSRLVSGGAIERVTVARGELEDFETVLRVVNEHEIDTVFHLAAQTIVGTASRSVLSTFEANVKGTWTLLEACRATGKLVERIVIASSDKAYGEHPTLPYTEDFPLQGRYPYDASKACAEIVALSFAKSFRLPVAITRCGNLYGGGDLNYSRIVPGTIRSALRGERPIIRSNGKLVRDYFYVEDAALAYLHLAEHFSELDLAGEAFNFGTGEPKSVLELVRLILSACGRSELEPRILDQATNEIAAQWLDCTKARERLGWSPRFTLEQGLARTVEWYRAREREALA